MRGINRVIISGNVGGQMSFKATGNGSAACSFFLASDRHSSGGAVVSAWVKINAYGDNFVRICRSRLEKGVYVLVEGELMNRDGPQLGELVEVRAREIIFLPREDAGRDDEGEDAHGSR
jgi:single-stranded DNA-binding protein